MSLGLIIEGIPLTGKTTLIKALEKNPFVATSSTTKLFYHEELTQRVLEKDYNRGFLDKTANINLLEEITLHLIKQASLLKRRGFTDKELPQLLFVLERFHITHAAYYPYLSWSDVAYTDQLLAELNTKLVLLTIERSEFRERLKERQNTGFIYYIRRYGQDLDTILDHYMRSQDCYLELASLSQLDTIVLDSVSLPPETVLKNTLDFWLKP